jgi:hypothetical protein
MGTTRHPADTDGILDRCSECGERARYTSKDDGSLLWGVECSECANCIDFHQSRDRAMIVWNQTQRRNLANRAGGCD